MFGFIDYEFQFQYSVSQTTSAFLFGIILSKETDMSSILIVYGSATGNTAAVADALGRMLEDKGHKTTVKNVTDVEAVNLCTGWDAVLFGCSAWGDEDIVLQDDFEVFFENFDQIDAKGHNAACFATGDSEYPHFCGAVDVIEEKLQALGAILIADGLKLDGDLSSNREIVAQWAEDIDRALA